MSMSRWNPIYSYVLKLIMSCLELPESESESMRARQDEDNDKATALPLIDTCGWDPEHQNGLHLLLLHPTLLHRDATTTELNIRVPLPPLNYDLVP